MNDIHLIFADAEARRYCDRQRITDYATYEHVARSVRHQYFMREIEPINAMKRRLFSLDTRCKVSTCIVFDDGHTEWRQPELEPETKKALGELDEAIILAAQRWGLDSSPIA